MSPTGGRLFLMGLSCKIFAEKILCRKFRGLNIIITAGNTFYHFVPLKLLPCINLPAKKSLESLEAGNSCHSK